MNYNVIIDQLNYDGLWCYLWASLGLNDLDAKSLASELTEQGIDTWGKWVNRTYLERPIKQAGEMFHSLP